MLSGVLRTKERKIIAALLALIILITGIFIYNGYIAKRRYEEQAVMAEEYLEAGNYEQAVEAYLKAMAMKNSNQELLSIGLAEAYVGVNNYDKALEILRLCYQKTGGKAIKEKIEAVTAGKTDFEFLQIINRADTYNSNEEYEKAITEYEKAKLIKSKEVTSYERIAEAYIAMGNYSLAREEILEGLAITQSEVLNKTLKRVDSYLLKEQYEGIIAEASEYIYQENYGDAIKKCEEAIQLLPKEESAYNRLAEVYITMGEYDKAIHILNNALHDIKSSALEEILSKAKGLVKERAERRSFFDELYAAVNSLDTDKIIELLDSSYFLDKIAKELPISYGPLGEGTISTGDVMTISDVGNLYSGGMNEGMKSGLGVFFLRINTEKEKGWYYYRGEWNNDIPNGTGKTMKETLRLNDKGETYLNQVVTEGTFTNGSEDGPMHKYFYADGKELGNVYYTAQNGVPNPYLNKNGQQIKMQGTNRYVIGEWYLKEDATGEYYSIEPGTKWGVKTYIKSY